MKRNLFLWLALMGAFSLSSCEKKSEVKTDRITFEELDPGSAGHYIGEDGSGGYTSGNAYFPIRYNAEYGSWSGFALSNTTDNTTAGIENQFSSITGTGAGGSSVYAVLYNWQPDTITFQVPEKITNISVCNSTYAYYSMLNGDQFAKKFGGESGNDPDYFRLIIEGLDESSNKVLEGTVTLADYTSDDNSQDYISNTWTDLDLSQAGFIKYLTFSFASSDTGAFGINTPTTVCIDNIRGELQE